MTSNNELVIDRVSAGFGEKQVLDSVSFSVAPGQKHVILGASGAGKSTLLQLIAGLQHPRSGSITIGGQDQAPVPTHKRRVGYMLQDAALFSHLTVGQNVAFGLRLTHDKQTAAALATDWLTQVDLADRFTSRIDTLSGGEQQRVALARTLAISPKVLLLDEPFGPLDLGLRRRLLATVADFVQTQAIPTVLVTHDQDEALAFADQVSILSAGRLLVSAPPADLVKNPKLLEVANFLGLPNVWQDNHAVQQLTKSAAAVYLPPPTVSIGGSDTEAIWQGKSKVVGHTYRGGLSLTELTIIDGELAGESLVTTASGVVGEVVPVQIGHCVSLS